MGKKILLRVILATTLAVFLGVVLSILAVNYVNLDTDKQELKQSSQYVRNDVAQMRTLSELQSYLADHNNGFFRISVISQDGTLIADSDFAHLTDRNFAEDHSFSKCLENGYAYQIGTAYTSSEVQDAQAQFIMYYEVLRSTALSDSEAIVVRVTAPMRMGNETFAISAAIGAAIWLLIVFMTSMVIRYFVRASLRPMQEIEQMLESLSEGDYHKATPPPMSGTEFDKLYMQINELGDKISDTLSDLRYEEQKNSLLLHSIDQGVIALSKKGTILLTNDAVNEIFGRSGSLIGLSIDMLLDDENILHAVTDALCGRKYTVNVLRIGGNSYRVETVFPTSKWKNEQGSLVMLLVLTNITQELNTANIRSEFFANASHELKTPLTAISGYSEWIGMQDIQDPKVLRCASEIHSNACKMKELIDNMLRLSKLDANMEQEEVQMVDLRAFCENVVKEQQIIADARNIKLYIEGTAKLPARPQMLQVLITNLVNNAIKYNKQDGSVWITLKQTDKQVILSVRDTGIGIAPENQGRLFERFYKVDTGRRRSAQESSTGLGLAIAKHIAMLHRGVIHVESTQGKGTTFTVVFDL